MTKIVRLLALASLLSIACTAHAEKLGRDGVVKDLQFLRDEWAPKDRSFSPEGRRRMVAYVAAAIRQAKPMEKYELALEFAQAEAFANNAHTYSDFFGEEGLFHTLPLSFWVFDEGPIVTRTHPEFSNLLGAKVVSIGGLPYQEAVSRVAKFIPGTAQRHLYLSPAWLSRIEVLEDVGLAKDGAVDIVFELPTGQRMTAHMGAAPTADPAALSPAWRASIVPGKGPNPWPHVLDRVPKLPLFAAAPDEFTSTPLGDGSTLYIRSTSLSPYEGENTVMAKAYMIMDRMVKAPLPRDIIVDLRYNGGGNMFNVIPFASELAQVVGARGHIYVMEGRATFSAAIAFAAMLKHETGGRAILVGEAASDNPWFWSEGGTMEAPASKLQLHYTTGFHDWAHGCKDFAKCYWPVVFHGAAVGSLVPDIPVGMRYADYAAGKDAALDAILADISRRRGLARKTGRGG